MLTSPLMEMSMLEHGKIWQAAGTLDCSFSNNACYEQSKCQYLRANSVGRIVSKTKSEKKSYQRIFYDKSA